jgi:hypothetical protein
MESWNFDLVLGCTCAVPFAVPRKLSQLMRYFKPSAEGVGAVIRRLTSLPLTLTMMDGEPHVDAESASNLATDDPGSSL